MKKKLIHFSFLQSLKESTEIELSEDGLKIRALVAPEKWPLDGPPISLISFNPDVAEFVPGKPYSAGLSATPGKQITFNPYAAGG